MHDRPSINGDPPDLQGRTLQELLVQSLYLDRKLAEEANVVYLMIDDTWHRLYFDYGIIFWRLGADKPEPSEFETDDGTHFQCSLIDLGRERNLIGREIDNYTMASVTDGSRVLFRMQNGDSFGFECLGDDSRILPK